MRLSLHVLLFIVMAFSNIAANAQTSLQQSITTSWGNYVNTDITVHGNYLVQVTVEGQNSLWNGLFSVNGTNSYTPSVIWNNVKLISYSGYNASVDDVQALIMSNTSPTAFSWTNIVLKLAQPATGSASISVVATGASTYTFTMSLTDHATSPFTYTMASSAGTYNMWTVNNNVGIGTINPEEKLHVNGNSRFNGLGWFSRNSNGASSPALYLGQLQGSDNPSVEILTSDDGGVNRSIWLSNRWGHALRFQRQSPTGNKNIFEIGGVESSDHYWVLYSNDGSTQKINFSAEGTSHIQNSLAIGTTNDHGYKLAVNGNILAQKLRITQTGWPDYVFHPAYKLPSLKDLEAYIKKNNHLPEVPSASDVEKNGLDVGDNQAVLLKKIEELTLYLIRQNEQIKELVEKNKKLEQRIQKIEGSKM